MPPVPPCQNVLAVIQIIWRAGAQSLLDKKQASVASASASDSALNLADDTRKAVSRIIESSVFFELLCLPLLCVAPICVCVDLI